MATVRLCGWFVMFGALGGFVPPTSRRKNCRASPGATGLVESKFPLKSNACAGTPRGDPFVMRRESGLDLRLLQGFPRSVPLHRPEPPQLRERDDGGGLPAEVDHLVRLGRIRVPGRLHTHEFNRTGH